MGTIFRILDSWFVPVLVGVAYLGLIGTSDMSPAISIVTLVFMGLILLLWSGFRELRLHAIASRHAAVGEPDELLVLADKQIAGRMRAGGRVPFQVYRAVAFELKGDREAATAALAAVQFDLLTPKSRRGWTALAAATKVNLLAQADDAAGARRAFEDELRVAMKGVPGPGAEIILREAEARVLLVEGKHDDARAMFEVLAKDIRLGPATRGACKYFIGKCLEATDPAAAQEAYAAAAKLAPRTWIAGAI